MIRSRVVLRLTLVALILYAFPILACTDASAGNQQATDYCNLDPKPLICP